MHPNLFEAALGAAAALAVPLAAAGLNPAFVETSLPAAQTVEIEPAAFEYPLPGEFLAAGRPVAAPVRNTDVPGFRIMKRQVGLAEYGRCVAAGACVPADAAQADEDIPVTGVNWMDAATYARWYSEATGRNWRLPTALELAAAAAERFSGEAYTAVADDPRNPAVRWIRRYREEAAARRPADPEAKPSGHYGPNTLGVEDFGGNVWEWTSTCHSRTTFDAGGKPESIVENCGVHVLEGRHRASMSNFVRDGRSGGCAVGTPPENLGFRLVLEDNPSLIGGLVARLRNVLAPTGFREVPRKDT